MKRLISVAAALMAAFMLSACSTGHMATDAKAIDEGDLVFIGAPAPLSWIVGGMQGTAFPATSTASLTAAHVAGPLLKRQIAQHAHCDVSAIKRDNTGRAVRAFATAYTSQKVRLYGYSSLTSLPKSSVGYVSGHFQMNGCTVALVSGAGAVTGMSGGPVVDDATGEIVGVLSAITTDGSGRVVFVPTQSISNVLSGLGVPVRQNHYLLK